MYSQARALAQQSMEVTEGLWESGKKRIDNVIPVEKKKENKISRGKFEIYSFIVGWHRNNKVEIAYH